MIKTTIYLLIGFLIYNGTNGPIVNIFTEPSFVGGFPVLYLWNVLMQLLAIAWIFYGLKKIPFISGVTSKE